MRVSAISDLEGAFAHPRAVELDERDEFPEEACRALDDWGLHHFYVPARFGGRLTSFEELLGLIRVVACHDVTVAVAHGKTLLGAISAWVAAEPVQAENLAGQILQGAAVSWGLSERAHGGDLLAGEVTAVLSGGSYRIDGEKWPVNNATRGQIMAVLARTSADGGPRGFDILLVDRRQLDQATYRCLPKELTHGIRGADISGIAYTGAIVPESARVGPPGSGLETVLKGLQLTRTMCAGLSLGAGDHAIKRAVRLAPGLPYAEAYADLLAAEAFAIAAGRSIHFLPAELSVLSAMVKYLVPTWIDDMIATLTRQIGRLAVEDPMLQKIGRDAAIVGLFDGSSVVNLNAIIVQLPILARARPSDRPAAGVYDVRVRPPEFDRDRLSLVSPRGVSLLNGLKDAVALIEPGPCALLGRRLLEQFETLRRELSVMKPTRLDIPATTFEAAARLATCAAGAAAIEVWLANRHHATGPMWHDGAWLAAVLARVLTRLGERPEPDPARDALLSPGLFR